VVQKRPPQGDSKGAYWVCKCVCGKVKEVRAVYLRSGKSLGCGCRSRYDVTKQSERFNKKYTKVVTTGCWEWNGPFTRGNYGTFTVNKKQYRAHRYAYSTLVGEIPENMLVCHKCDNPKCVNPEHLFLGSHLDNNHDMHSKGRAPKTNPKIAGVNNKVAKLTDNDVRTIRDLAACGVSKAEIGRKYSIRDSHVCKIVLRQLWRHVV